MEEEALGQRELTVDSLASEFTTEEVKLMNDSGFLD